MIKERKRMITLEESLKPILIKNRSKLIRGSFGGRPLSFLYADEIDGGFGVADLMFYKVKSKYLNQRKNLCPITSEDAVKTLLFIQDKKTFSVSFLQENLPFSKERIQSILLKTLVPGGFVKRVDKEYFENIWNYRMAVEKSLAIELKLKDWKGGLYQAYRYKWFSDVSYLALYHRHSTQAKKNLHLFEQYNVGLIDVFDDNTIKVVYQPKVEEPYSLSKRAITNEYLYKKTYSYT